MKNKITGIIVALFILFSPLLSIGSGISSSGDDKVVVQTIGTHVMDVEKMIWDEAHSIWTNEIYADAGDTVRFKIRVTYHDPDDDGPSYKLKWITITDTLPPSLTYAYNATIPETSASLDGHTISWLNLTDVELLDGESVEVAFDAHVSNGGIHINTADVAAFETCPHIWYNAKATATVYAISGPAYKTKDVDSDGNDETATDINRDLTDGYESYADDDGSSDVVVSIDGDDDGKIDYFIDITGNSKPERYWDPDDDILTDINLIDVDGDGTKEWVYDSDDDGKIDRYYDPDDEKIHLYDTEPPTVEIVKPKKRYIYKNDIRRRRTLFRTIIIGPITIKADVNDDRGIEKVEFYINGELKHTDTKEPYKWTWMFKPIKPLLRKKYTIEVVAYDLVGNHESDRLTVWRERYHPLLDHPLLTLGSALLVSKLLQSSPEEEEPPEPPGPGPTFNQPPVADAGGPYSGAVDTVIHFDGSASYDPDGTIISYSWDFGDGETGTGKMPSHTYKTSGKYTVTLTVTDDDGEKTTDKATVTVSEVSNTQGEIEPFWYIVGGLSIILLVSLIALAFRRDLFE